MKIILASQSLFRKHALDVLGVSYETIPSNFDESSVVDADPIVLVKKLAEAKARKIGEEYTNALVIAADLVIVFDNAIFGKPNNLAEARRTLQQLSGNHFDIVAGLAVYNVATNRMLSAVEKCVVTFRPLQDHEIDDYIQRYPVLKCGGSFEADGLLRFAESVNGNYNFPTGLPVNRLIEFLRANKINV